MMNDDARGLVPLEDLEDFEVADGYTDIRGFDAYVDNDRKIGQVDQLLVDANAGRVAVITIDVDGDLLDAGREPRAQVPIEDVEIDTPTRRVFIQGAGVEYLGLSGRAAAASGAAAVGAAASRSDDFDSDDNRGFGEATRRDSTSNDERITLAEEELSLDKRQVSAGELAIDKRVETEHVRESVPVTREEVTIERRPVTDANVGTDARFERDEIHIPLVQEEVVVEKHAVFKEELVIHKDQVQDQQLVEADLRRERAEVHQSDDVRRADGSTGDVDLDNPLRGGRDLDGDGVR